MSDEDQGRASIEELEKDNDPVYGGPAKMDLDARLYELPAVCKCPNCPRAPRLLTQRFRSFFNGALLSCPTCGEPIEIWHQCNTYGGGYGSLMGFVGARVSMGNFDVSPTGDTQIDVTDLGIPSSAMIEGVQVEAYIDVDPINQYVQEHGTFPDHMVPRNWTPRLAGSGSPSLFGPKIVTVHSVGEPKDAAKIRATVEWIDPAAQPSEWELLVEAFRNYRHGQLAVAVVSANTALESALFVTMSNSLEDIVGSKRLRAFLTQEATYASQLQILLPLITSERGWPKPKDPILAKLNRLRKLRNACAHEGLRELDPKEVGELMVSALFGMHYFMYLGTKS